MPLTFADIGQKSCIKRITGRDEIQLHLTELGFVVGSEVTVVSRIGGNVILSIKGSRIALDKTMANRIIVC